MNFRTIPINRRQYLKEKGSKTAMMSFLWENKSDAVDGTFRKRHCSLIGSKSGLDHSLSSIARDVSKACGNLVLRLRYTATLPEPNSSVSDIKHTKNAL